MINNVGFVSVLDEAAVLNKENFEFSIACGSSKSDLLTIFGKSSGEMDKWCLAEYHLHFDETYGKILRVIRNKFLNKCDLLSDRGNATALNIMANFLMNYAANNGGGEGGVTIVNNVPGGVVVDGSKE